MGFFSSAISTLQTLVVALGAGLAVWGAVNLLEGGQTVVQSEQQRNLRIRGSRVQLRTSVVSRFMDSSKTQIHDMKEHFDIHGEITRGQSGGRDRKGARKTGRSAVPAERIGGQAHRD